MAVQGIMNGLRPIFIDADNSFRTNDPLPLNLSFRKVVKTAKELNNLLLNDKNYPDIGNKEFKIASQFAKEYITPINTKSLLNILERYQC